MRIPAPVIVDTNVMIKMFDDDPHAKKLCRYVRTRKWAYLIDVVRNELEKHDHKHDLDYLEVKHRVRFVEKNVTSVDRTEANALEEAYSEFHFPDSLIAAFTKHHMGRVLTFDQGMLDGCKRAGIYTKDAKSVIFA